MNIKRGTKDGFFRSVSFWLNALTSGLTLLLCPCCPLSEALFIQTTLKVQRTGKLYRTGRMAATRRDRIMSNVAFRMPV